MNITTKHTSNVNGRGQVVATATINGKRKQKTISWDHSVSAARNHGVAAAQLVRPTMTLAEAERAARGATHMVRDDGSHVFTI